jgi:hypothetical protein
VPLLLQPLIIEIKEPREIEREICQHEICQHVPLEMIGPPASEEREVREEREVTEVREVVEILEEESHQPNQVN